MFYHHAVSNDDDNMVYMANSVHKYPFQEFNLILCEYKDIKNDVERATRLDSVCV